MSVSIISFHKKKTHIRRIDLLFFVDTPRIILRSGNGLITTPFRYIIEMPCPEIIADIVWDEVPFFGPLGRLSFHPKMFEQVEGSA